jgi:hypothetical protein
MGWKYSKERGLSSQILADKWTSSIDVGSRSLVGNVNPLLGFRAKGGEVIGGNVGYQLREGSARYKALFGTGNEDIGIENKYFWGLNNE